MDDPLDVEELEKLEMKLEKPRQQFSHMCEGIYLPLLWGSQPVSRSPLVLAFRNGIFHAVIVSDSHYQREQEVHRLLRIQRSRRYGENLFRFLNISELDNASLISQFITLGPCSPESITIRRDTYTGMHTFLYESLHFYGSWVNAMHCCDYENSGVVKMSQIEGNIDSLDIDRGVVCFDKFSIFNPRAVTMLSATLPHTSLTHQHPQAMHSLPESSKNEMIQPAHLADSDGDEDDDEDNESLIDEPA